MEREDEIRLTAYAIWEQEGCPNGKDCEHWLKAESVWQEEQKDAPVSTDTKSNAKQTAKQGKSDRTRSKKH